MKSETLILPTLFTIVNYVSKMLVFINKDFGLFSLWSKLMV